MSDTVLIAKNHSYVYEKEISGSKPKLMWIEVEVYDNQTKIVEVIFNKNKPNGQIFWMKTSSLDYFIKINKCGSDILKIAKEYLWTHGLNYG